MWSSYSAREAASLLGMSESAVRACVRDGLVGQGDDLPVRLSFRDLAALRTVKQLVDAGLPMPRVRRTLRALLAQVGHARSIAELAIEAHDGQIFVAGEVVSATPQLELRLSWPPQASAGLARGGSLHALPAPLEGPGPMAAPVMTTDDWFARALALEETDVEAAIEAYRRALRLRSDRTELWVNLGRLYAESSRRSDAAECFQAALRLDPVDATAIYNLGVVAQDDGREVEAIDHYQRSLDLDPSLAEAHYNLATLFDQTGDTRAAIRHINEYRKLTREK